MNHLKMMGSSIFQQWGIPKWNGLNITNVAVGGTTAACWAECIEEHITSDVWNYAIYCGSNDLKFGFSEASIIKSIADILVTIQQADSKNQVAYFSIMKAPEKADKFAVIDQINTTVTQHLRNQDLYIDLNLFINQDPKWYVEDDLHLTAACYLEIEDRVGSTVSHWAV